jgi:ABC-type multidrug transport system ATPase subunit
MVGVIDDGRLLALDTPAMLRYQAYGGDMIDLRTTDRLEYTSLQDISALPFVLSRILQQDNRSVRLVVNEAKKDIPTLLDWARNRGLQVESIEPYLPPFDDVFVELVKKEDEVD